MKPDCALVCGIIARGTAMFEKAELALEREFGAIRRRSPDMAFDFTDYYAAEMGAGLVRRWVAFDRHPEPDRLAETKQATILLEKELCAGGPRPANLDPGLLSAHNLVLASTKAHAHRVYLSDGIFAEVTLVYRHGAYQPLEWTYPDYCTETCRGFMAACRPNTDRP